MQDELKRYSDRIRAEGRLPIQPRVGGPEGRPSFSLLRNSRSCEHTIAFDAFDFLLLGGEDLNSLPLEAGREMLPRNRYVWGSVCPRALEITLKPHSCHTSKRFGKQSL
jgi:hypothetical protein